MSNIVEFQSFKLKKGVSVSDFLLASDKFNNDFLSKQKGYIAYQVLSKGDTWYDFLAWESAEDIQTATQAYIAYEAETDRHYISFIDEDSRSELLHLQLEKSY